MEDKNKVEQLFGNIKEYAETRFDIMTLNMQDKVSEVLSSIASILVVGVFSLFTVFFVSVGLAWWIGQLLHNTSIGFFIVAGFYLLIGSIIFIYRDKWIKFPIINTLLSKININEQD